MGILKKLGIALLVILLVILVAGYFLTRGDTADIAFEETVGTDPTLDEPAEESFPTVAIAEPVGWGEDELPTAAEGLAVTRFADGLDHPRTLQALPNGDILVSLTRAPKIDSGESNFFRDLVAGFLFRKAGAGGESANLIGARRLVETGALAGHGAILVGEPTSLDLVTATTSALWLRAEARGTVGHGSDGTGGAGGPAVNAIVALARALDGLETALPEATHPLLGGATLNIGRIEGGSAINLMPDRCAADLDLRLPPGVTAKAAETALAARLGPGIRLTRLDWKPAQETAPDAPLGLC